MNPSDITTKHIAKHLKENEFTEATYKSIISTNFPHDQKIQFATAILTKYSKYINFLTIDNIIQHYTIHEDIVKLLNTYKRVLCKCRKQCFIYRNISTGDYTYKCFDNKCDFSYKQNGKRKD